MRRVPGSQRVIVFDMDGVLTRKDTLTHLVGEYLAQRPVLALRASGLLRELSRSPHASAQRADVSLRLVALAFGRCDPEEYARRSRRFARRIAQEESWITRPLVAVARAHLDRGDEVVVLTGSERILARELVDALDLPEARVIGSVLRSEAADGDAVSGLDPYLYGAAKRAAWERLGYSGRPYTFYTDSIADVPTAIHAEEVHLVNPRPEDVEAMRAAIPGVQVDYL